MAPTPPTPSTQTTPNGSIITPSTAHTPTTFNKIMSILAATEPLILAGVSPFIKNTQSQIIVNEEAPGAEALLTLLSEL
jgi:hypothetical protein